MNELDLFTEALNRTDPAERAAFLDQACAGNPELRQRLEELLAGHAQGRSPLDRPPLAAEESTETVDLATALATGEHRPDEGTETLAHVDPMATTDVRSGAPTPPTDATGEFRPEGAATIDHVDSDATKAASRAPTPRAARVTTGEGIGTVIAGRYTLVEVIGEGGMGSVYLASQTEPVKRQVALKLIKTGMDSRGVLARFDAERQALALMDHPNIARIYDGGTHPGRPAVLRDGAGPRRAVDRLLRPEAAVGEGPPGAVRGGLPGGAARPPEGDHPPRPEAGQRAGHRGRRPRRRPRSSTSAWPRRPSRT